jgi:hypothetical protein
MAKRLNIHSIRRVSENDSSIKVRDSFAPQATGDAEEAEAPTRVEARTAKVQADSPSLVDEYRLADEYP